MKKLVILSLFLFCASTLIAQRNLWTVNYRVSFSSGELNDYISSMSWRGIGVEGRQFVTSQIALGGHFSWSVFNEKVRDDVKNINGTVETDEGELPFNADVGGTQFRYVNLMPLLFTTHYYFGDDYEFRPYLGVGMGVYRSLQRTEVGLMAVQNNNWHFGLAPEIGIMIPTGDFNNALMLSLRYDHPFASNGSINYTNFSINLGISYMR